MTSLLAQLLNSRLCREAGKGQLGYFHNWSDINYDGCVRHMASSKWISQFWGEDLVSSVTSGAWDTNMNIPSLVKISTFNYAQRRIGSQWSCYKRRVMLAL